VGRGRKRPALVSLVSRCFRTGVERTRRRVWMISVLIHVRVCSSFEIFESGPPRAARAPASHRMRKTKWKATSDEAKEWRRGRGPPLWPGPHGERVDESVKGWRDNAPPRPPGACSHIGRGQGRVTPRGGTRGARAQNQTRPNLPANTEPQRDAQRGRGARFNPDRGAREAGEKGRRGGKTRPPSLACGARAHLGRSHGVLLGEEELQLKHAALVRRVLRPADHHAEVPQVVLLRLRADARRRLRQQPLRLLRETPTTQRTKR
jgi:hypothetical protein